MGIATERLKHQITTVSRGAALRAAGHRGRGKRSQVKGGGHAFAALAVGSRRVGKRKTLSARCPADARISLKG